MAKVGVQIRKEKENGGGGERERGRIGREGKKW